MSGVFRPAPPQPQATRHGVYPAAPAAYTIPGLAGSQAGTGAHGKAITLTGLAGSQTATGVATKTVTVTGLVGSQTGTGVATGRRVYPIAGLGGSLTSTGALGAKAVAHNTVGAQTATGAVAKAVTHTGLAGSQTSTGAVATYKLQIRAFTGSQTATGIVLKTVIKPLAGAGNSNGFTPKTVTRRHTATFTPTAVTTTIRLPASGQRVSPATTIPAGPIAGSRISWDVTFPDPSHSTTTVETSLNNGATWQTATNGAPIPLLVVGTSTARSVMTRVTMTRGGPSVPTPSMTRLSVLVSVDTGRDEFCPLGVYTLSDTSINDSPAGLYIEIAGEDLSRRLGRNRWDTTYTIQPGTNYTTAIQGMVNDRMPGLEMNFASTVEVTPQLQFGQASSNDPWQDIQKLATSIGHEIFFDARGVLVLRPIQDPDQVAAQWTFEDMANPTITNLVRRVSDVDTYNKVIVSGEGTGNTVPVQAIAQDNDPASPTYVLGEYGTVTYQYRGPEILTADQAQTAANALLLKVKGATEAVEIDVVPMPAIEPGDVIGVTRGRAKVDGRFLVDQMTTPLGAGDTMHITGRRQRL